VLADGCASRRPMAMGEEGSLLLQREGGQFRLDSETPLRDNQRHPMMPLENKK